MPKGIKGRVKCRLPECESFIVYKNGYCNYHWYRDDRYGDPRAETRNIPRVGTCHASDCDRPIQARGYCTVHLQRLYLRGDAEYVLGTGPFKPRKQIRVKPIPDRLFANLDTLGPLPRWHPHLGPCWVWLGNRQTSGHGQMKVRDKTEMAHRLVYEWLIGPIPEDHVLDHICRHGMDRACCNPFHLEPVLMPENSRRASLCPRCQWLAVCPDCDLDLTGHGHVPYAPFVQPRTIQRFQRIHDLESYFWDHLDFDGPPSGLVPGNCWDWTGRLNPSGYGEFPRAKAPAAHRFAMEMATMTRLGTLVVDHRCRRRLCCNFREHLEIVTKAENSKRRMECARCQILQGCPACSLPVGLIQSASTWRTDCGV